MRRGSRKAVVFTAVLALGQPRGAGAQVITRDNYYDYLPPTPRIVAQTRASAALRLYGDERDPSYRDADPVDGVDDARARRLLALAEQFSPLLRRNNFSVPRDLDAVLGPRHTLHVDSWVGNRRVHSDSVALGQTGGTAPRDDDALLALLQAFHPRAGRPGFVQPEGELEKVLFFDMPGQDPRSWRQHFRRLDAALGSRIFVHPFVQDDTVAGAAHSERYQLVFQFWFFYPFNDAANTHEGDWENINVIVATRAAAARARPGTFDRALHSASEIGRILDERFPSVDSLVIAAVDYYFHHNVLTLDYLALGAAPAPRPGVVLDERYVWEDRDFISKTLQTRLTYASGQLATHPIVYIGGNNKGPDELMSVVPRFYRSFKRNSGGSFPFPGVWQTIGPLGVTEKVAGAVVPRVRRDPALAWHMLVDDPHYIRYLGPDMRLLPDWERLEELMLTDDDVRRRLGWLLLPVYWGFPVSPSPGAGLVKHVDIGNIAPLSPPYHPAWNNTGESQEHRAYRPRVLRTPVSPTTPWAALQSGWGILNAPLAAWGLMPGYNVALIQLMPWMAGAMHVFGAPQARTFTQARLPRRFTTAGPGVFVEFGGRGFAGLVPRNDSTVRELVATNGAAVDEASAYRRDVAGPRVWFNLYFGEKFSLENTFSWATGDLGYGVRRSDGAIVGSVHGSLHMRQLTGGLRYDLASVADQALRFYARAGYGWLWYEGRDFYLAGSSADGPLQHRASRRGSLPPILPSRHWWPNTWYGGAGAEVFSPERYWLLRRLGYGVRVEFTELFNKLAFDDELSGRGDVTSRRGDLAFSLVFGW